MSRRTIRFVRPLLGLARSLVRQPPIPDGIETSDLAIDDAGREIDIRLYRPAGTSTALPVLLWIHGGGLIIGDHRDDAWGGYYADRLGIAVVSPRYRLAPEHPFPAALDDLLLAARWVLSGGDGRFDPDRVAIGGESAGGGLTAAVVHRLHDEGVSVASQLLVYPMLDDRTAVRSDFAAHEHAVWDKALNHLGWACYLDRDPGSADPPSYSVPARRADLTGLPPAWIGVGSIDLFHDECREYADRLRAAGVPCRFELIDAAPHGFASIAPTARIAMAFKDSSSRFLQEVLTPVSNQ
jgi:acetyl esterase/lipase